MSNLHTPAKTEKYGMKRFDLSGKVALVTGGSRGIGRGIAVGLAEAGADVVINYRSADAAARKVAGQIEALGRGCLLLRQDLAEIEKLPDLAEQAWAFKKRIDILVNNAGVAYLESFADVTPKTWDHVMNVNLKAAFFLTQAVAKRMIEAKNGGRIINLSSKNGFSAEAHLSHYNASKGAIELLTQSLAIELGRHNITVNTIAPGIIETEIAGEFHLPQEFFDYYLEHIRLGRFGTVEDCVGAAIFLAGDAAAYMTGQHIIIDGGVLCEQVPRLQFCQ